VFPVRYELNWLLVPNGPLTPRRTGQLIVGRNVALTLTWTASVVWLQNGGVLFPERYELNLYMLCRRKSVV
jgi:hypothetical protein